MAFSMYKFSNIFAGEHAPELPRAAFVSQFASNFILPKKIPLKMPKFGVPSLKKILSTLLT